MTRIRQLPQELGKLVKLRQLNLRHTLQLRDIPPESILMLTRLQILVLCDSAYRWSGDDSRGTKLSDVGCHLDRLEELSVDVHTLSCLEMLANSKKLPKCTRVLVLLKVADLMSPHLSAALDKMESLRQLVIRGCSELEVWRVGYCNNQSGSLEHLLLDGLEQLKEVVVEAEAFGITQGGGRRGHFGPSLVPPLFSSLSNLHIFFCHKLKDLRWIGQLPRLELLFLLHCKGLEELLVGNGGEAENDDDHDTSFPKLKNMYLTNLQALRIISMRPLLFPSLEYLQIRECPQLKRLPLGNRSCKNIKAIEAEQQWWEALEGDDCGASSSGNNSIKLTLAPFFLPIHPPTSRSCLRW